MDPRSTLMTQREHLLRIHLESIRIIYLLFQFRGRVFGLWYVL